MDDEVDRPEPPSAKAVTALLREARSLSRRADKLSGTAAAVDDPTTQQLAAEACTSLGSPRDEHHSCPPRRDQVHRDLASVEVPRRYPARRAGIEQVRDEAQRVEDRGGLDERFQAVGSARHALKRGGGCPRSACLPR
jgi:hypothetical protein